MARSICCIFTSCVDHFLSTFFFSLSVRAVQLNANETLARNRSGSMALAFLISVVAFFGHLGDPFSGLELEGFRVSCRVWTRMQAMVLGGWLGWAGKGGAGVLGRRGQTGKQARGAWRFFFPLFFLSLCWRGHINSSSLKSSIKG